MREKIQRSNLHTKGTNIQNILHIFLFLHPKDLEINITFRCKKEEEEKKTTSFLPRKLKKKNVPRYLLPNHRHVLMGLTTSKSKELHGKINPENRGASQ